jgi:spore germination protein KC
MELYGDQTQAYWSTTNAKEVYSEKQDKIVLINFKECFQNMKQKIIIALFLIMIIIPLLSNRSYSEVEDRYLVIGAAFDFDFDKNLYNITVEVIASEDSSSDKAITKSFSGSGVSLFDAIRNVIKISGKRLFWSHMKVAIINKDLAAQSIYPIMGWINREHELRNDALILISREKTAKEIIECKPSETSIPSNVIEKMLENNKSIPKYPNIDFWEFSHDFSTSGIEPIAPAIQIIEVNGKRYPQVTGTAVFSRDVLVGFLDDTESMVLLAVRNKLRGGVLYFDKDITNLNTGLSLEIFDSSTKLKPRVEDDKVTVEIIVKSKLGIADTETTLNFQSKDVIEQIKKTSSSYIEKHIAKIVKIVQEKYKSDIFGFGKKINISFPSYWKEVASDWNENFSNLEFSVKVDAEISSTGLVSKPLKKE